MADDAQDVAAAPASLGDVVKCYQLLLGRPPDPGGLDHYRSRLEAGALSVGELVGEFLSSMEFARAYADRVNRSASTFVVDTVEGFRLHLDPRDHVIGHGVALTGGYEPEVTATVKAFLRPGGTFVDVGANVGWFSLVAGRLVGPEGRVVALEPNPYNVFLLQSSAQDNRLANITALAVAVAEQDGTMALETDGSNGRVIPVPGPPPEPVRASYVVAARPLDRLLTELGVERVDMVKVDVEGAEPLVIRGAEEVLTRHRPLLVSEFYPLALDLAPWGSARGYLQMLRDLGYRLWVIGDGSANVGPDGGDGEGASDEAILEAARQPGRDHVDLLARPAPG